MAAHGVVGDFTALPFTERLTKMRTENWLLVWAMLRSLGMFSGVEEMKGHWTASRREWEARDREGKYRQLC